MLEEALKTFAGTIVLISHDEHLVRAVANKVVDVRDHKVTLYDGDYEYFEFKRAELEARAAEAAQDKADTAATSAPLKSQAQSQPSGKPQAHKAQAQPSGSGRNVKTKEQRRAEAEARQAASKALRSTKKRLEEVEKALTPAQKRYEELMKLMASEELYADSAKFDQAKEATA